MGKRVPEFLTMLRYTMFFFLYPLGLLGELGILYAATGALHNLVGKVIIGALMLMYILGFPVMYGHMIKQRKKVLKEQDSE